MITVSVTFILRSMRGTALEKTLYFYVCMMLREMIILNRPTTNDSLPLNEYIFKCREAGATEKRQSQILQSHR